MNNSQPLDGYLGLSKKIHNKTTADTFRRGIISAVHIAANTVDVIILGSNASTMRNVQVSSAININNIQNGQKCKLWMFSETNPNDCVCEYTYGTAATPKANSGYASIPATQTHYAIRHGLQGVPTIVTTGIWPQGIPAGGGVPGFVSVSTTGPAADATNIYVDSVGYAGNRTCYWAAAIV